MIPRRLKRRPSLTFLSSLSFVDHIDEYHIDESFPCIQDEDSLAGNKSLFQIMTPQES